MTCMLGLLIVACLGVADAADHCASYTGASEVYALAEQNGVPLVEWSCTSCNCCDTEDMENASSAAANARRCETMQVFWFDPQKISQGSRYRCSASERARLDAAGFDVSRCSDPSYQYFSNACCCLGCTEPIEVVYPLLASKQSGIGEAPANRTDVCQCGPEILPLATGGRRLQTGSNKVYQERLAGEDVGKGDGATGMADIGNNMCSPLFVVVIACLAGLF